MAQKVAKSKTNVLPHIEFSNGFTHVQAKYPRHLAFYEIAPQILQNLDVEELVDYLDNVAYLLNKSPFDHIQIFSRKTRTDSSEYVRYLDELRKSTDYAITNKVLTAEMDYVDNNMKKSYTRHYYFVVDVTGLEDQLSVFEASMKFLKPVRLADTQIEALYTSKVFLTPARGLEDVYTAPIQHKKYNLVQEQVQIGDFYHKTYVVNRYPKSSNTFFISDVMSASGNFDVLYDLVKVSEKKVANKLSVMHLESEAGEKEGRIDNRIKKRKAKENVENILEEFADELQKIWQFNMLFDVYDTNPKEVDNTSQNLSGALATNKMAWSLFLKGVKDWIQTLPFGLVTKETQRRFTYYMHSKLVSKIYPGFTQDYSETKGLIVGENVDTGNLVIVDRLDRSKYRARNMQVFGSTGGGKTFAVETDIVRAVTQDYQVLVITPDRGYNFSPTICNKVRFGISHANAINPFQIDSLIVDADEGMQDQIGGELYFMKKIDDVIGFLKQITEVTSTEAGEIETIIIDLYAKHGYTPQSMTVPTSFPNLEDLYNEAVNRPSLERFSAEIKRFATGYYSHIFAKDRAWNLTDKPITVLDIQGLGEGELRTIIMDALIKMVWENVKIFKKKFIVYIDEIQQLFRTEKGVQLGVDLAKRIRKYADNQGGAVFITQNPSDMLKHPGAEVISKNCDFHMIFPIRSDDINELRKIDIIPTKEQRKFLTSSIQHQCIFKAGSTSATVQIHRLPEEWEAFV